MDEINPSNEGERPQTILDREDDGAEARRKQRFEDILMKPLNDAAPSNITEN